MFEQHESQFGVVGAGHGRTPEARAQGQRLAAVGGLAIFASYGDNITPAHQALGWIPVVYEDTGDLKKVGQRIVYVTNPHVGHLGIFVLASVACLEHRTILESLDEIGALEPGLYEMKIDNPSGDPDCHEPQYTVRFKERKIEDLDVPLQDEALALYWRLTRWFTRPSLAPGFRLPPIHGRPR